MICFDGYDNTMLTFNLSGTAVAGNLTKIVSSETVAACTASGDIFMGVVECVDDGYASVQTKGYVEAAYSGTAPSVGVNNLVANGTGGVEISATGAGRDVLVISLDTTNSICGFIL